PTPPMATMTPKTWIILLISSPSADTGHGGRLLAKAAGSGRTRACNGPLTRAVVCIVRVSGRKIRTFNAAQSWGLAGRQTFRRQGSWSIARPLDGVQSLFA